MANDDRLTVPDGKKRAPTRWRNTIQFRLLIGLGTAALAVIVANSILIQFVAQRTLYDRNIEDVLVRGESLVYALETEIALADSLTRSIAHATEALPHDTEALEGVIANILKPRGQSDLVAGGGIWPEPFALDPSRERAGLLWVRGSKGQMQFVDSFNTSDEGYHNESWYLPIRYRQTDRCLWSAAYIDPVTAAPMVTCSVAM